MLDMHRRPAWARLGRCGYAEAIPKSTVAMSFGFRHYQAQFDQLVHDYLLRLVDIPGKHWLGTHSNLGTSVWLIEEVLAGARKRLRRRKSSGLRLHR